MKKYDEIKDIIVNRLGYSNLETYLAKTKEHRLTPLSEEELNLLSPDAVDNHDFWQVSQDLFGCDPVCNQKSPTKSILQANRQNRRLAQATGCLGWLDMVLDDYPPTRVIEIGPGFGNIKNHIEANHSHSDYVGVDVMPRIPDVIQATPQGLLPEGFVEQFKGQFYLAYSCNVFQHLSKKQQESYFADIYNLLSENGLMIVSQIISDDKPPTQGNFDEAGVRYLHHYGQFTPLPTFNQWTKMLYDYGFGIIVNSVRQMDAYSSFLVQKRKTNNDLSNCKE